MRAARGAAAKNLKGGDSENDMDEWIAREKLQRRPSGLVAVTSPREEDEVKDPLHGMFKYYLNGKHFYVRPRASVSG